MKMLIVHFVFWAERWMYLFYNDAFYFILYIFFFLLFVSDETFSVEEILWLSTSKEVAWLKIGSSLYSSNGSKIEISQNFS